MEYGLQLYSVRDAMEKDVKGTLKRVAEIGYKQVEFAGFFGVDAPTMKSWLDEFGLRVSGTHTNIYELNNNYDEIVNYHKVIGCNNLIMPWADTSTPEKIAELLDLIKIYQPRLKADGITLGYHNHDHEFHVQKDGTLPYAILELCTDVQLEVDTYWAFMAGMDPLAVMERLKDRIHFIHLKDGTLQREGRPLGTGEAPVAAVIQKAKELGFDMIVESENLQPDGLTEVDNCFSYLKTIEA